MSRYLIVAYFIEVGLILVLVPWSGFWDRNYFADTMPAVRAIAHSHFVRGAVSGLGMVNLAAGVADLLTLLGLRRR
ncbi:MAG: hypothetical protein IMZ67_03725 [Acidobacteria bacterium]|nr:hypothetical protein [Acidobacteriota bacterium]